MRSASGGQARLARQLIDGAKMVIVLCELAGFASDEPEISRPAPAMLVRRWNFKVLTGALARPSRIERSDGFQGESKMGFRCGRVAAFMAATAAMAATITVAMPARMAQAQVTPSSRPPSVSSQGAPVNDLPLADYQAFDQFSAGHPDIINELGHHPQLIEDQEYLAKHPQLRDFLAAVPRKPT